MTEKEKIIIRDLILERYGVDTDEANCFFSTQNYAYVFPDHPYMVRVSKTAKKTRKEILSELMWVDDLKQFKQTICEPSVSLKGNLLEEFEIDNVVYRASMFRTARGYVQVVKEMTPMFFICAGELLGMIHHVSTNERENGMHFQRISLAEAFAIQKEKVWNKLDAGLQKKVTYIEAEVNKLPQDLGLYGLCHGDFHVNNFFVEANNIWLFDFDGCCYAHYLYDVASFIQACFLQGYGKGKDCKDVIENDMLPYIKTGYELNHQYDESFWEKLSLFFSYRAAYTVLMLSEIEYCGVGSDLNNIKNLFQNVLLQDDIYEAMTRLMNI